MNKTNIIISYYILMVKSVRDVDCYDIINMQICEKKREKTNRNKKEKEKKKKKR